MRNWYPQLVMNPHPSLIPPPQYACHYFPLLLTLWTQATKIFIRKSESFHNLEIGNKIFSLLFKEYRGNRTIYSIEHHSLVFERVTFPRKCFSRNLYQMKCFSNKCLRAQVNLFENRFLSHVTLRNLKKKTVHLKVLLNIMINSIKHNLS